jgi:hypothetical protein
MTDLGYQPVGWLFLNLKLAPWLAELQRTTLEEVQPFIESAAIDRNKSLEGYTSAERRSYLRYGYRYTGSSFKPHITLGRLAPASISIVDGLRVEFEEAVGWWSSSPRALMFYEAGQFGVIERVISEIPW